MPSKPDTMTRLLDTIAALGGEHERYIKHVGVWVVRGYGYPVSSATPTEIMAAAFVLEGMMQTRGWTFFWQRERYWGRKAHKVGGTLGLNGSTIVQDPDRIEALLIAGKKLREGSK